MNSYECFPASQNGYMNNNKYFAGPVGGGMVCKWLCVGFPRVRLLPVRKGQDLQSPHVGVCFLPGCLEEIPPHNGRAEDHGRQLAR